MVKLSWLRDREKALRHARSKPFVDDSEIQRHGNGHGLIGSGVKKLAVQHVRNGNETRFALIRNLYQAQCTRSLVDLLSPVLLGNALRGERSRIKHQDRESERSGERKDDGAQSYAI